MSDALLAALGRGLAAALVYVAVALVGLVIRAALDDPRR